MIPLVLLAAVAAWLDYRIPALFFLALAGFVAFFFRDPQRVSPSESDIVLSPADGRVIKIQPEDGQVRLSIFLSVFNVHINRAPISGKIVRQDYRPGKFYLAFDERASVQNEQMIYTIRGERELTFSLIAGILARRIVPWKKVGEFVNKGDRIALIRFGSRADIMLPTGCEIVVAKGDKVRAGKSVIAKWRE